MLGLLEGVAGLALDGVDVDLVEFLDEEFAVFGVDDGLDGGAEDADVVFVEYALFVEFYAAVEGGLSAEAEEYAVGVFFLYDFLYEVGGDGKEVDAVGYAFGGLDGGDVGVDEYALYAFFFEGFEGL